MNKKRLLAIFMVCTFLAGVFPVQSYATEDSTKEENIIEDTKEDEETLESETETEIESETESETETEIESETETDIETETETESDIEVQSSIGLFKSARFAGTTVTDEIMTEEVMTEEDMTEEIMTEEVMTEEVMTEENSIQKTTEESSETLESETEVESETETETETENEEIDIPIDYTTTWLELPEGVNFDYTINGIASQRAIRNPVARVKGENWYKELVIQKGSENPFKFLFYRQKGDKKWKRIKITDEAWVIDSDTVASYEFYFANNSKKVKAEYILELNNVAVDTKAPTISKELMIDIAPSSHSTSDVAYFNEDVTLKVTQAGDAGAGIASLTIRYIKDGDVTEEKEYKVDASNRYDKEYEFILEGDKDYGRVEIIAEDYLGYKSTVASYEKEICIDTVKPVVTMESIDIDYNGEWTSKPLKFAISSLEESQVSGIHSYQYAIVSRGNVTEPEWIDLSKDSLYLTLGSDLPEEYERLNGTIYLRAESNAGLVTTNEEIENTKKEVRIWQQELEAAIVNFDKEPDALTGWYNKETGEVTISFEYPEYDEDNIAPAVGIVYSFTTRKSNDDLGSTINRSFYKGILNEESKEVIEVSDFTDVNKITSLIDEGTIRILEDSINTLVVYVEDAAGNKSQEVEYEIKADYIAPDNLVASADGTPLNIYTSETGGTATYCIFSQNVVNVSASAQYGISERGSLLMSLTKQQGIKGEDATDRDSYTISPCNRGLVYICATDLAGNKTEAWTDGIVSDNQAPVGMEGREITIRTKGENAAGFYNKDIPLEIEINDAPSQDNFSGLKRVTYQVGKNSNQLSGEITLSNNSSNNLSWSQIESMYSYSGKDLIIDAAQNESNYAAIKVTAVDNAGNLSTSTKEIKIDVTAPTINISFDNNNAQNQVYYNTDRTARIDITELNFDPSLVELTIYKDGAIDGTLNAGLSNWTLGDNAVHTSYITFNQDGDYYFEVKCRDMADNESQTASSEEFTIDMTKPVISVSYDNDNPWKENYYNQPRTAIITVTEHNFNPNNFEAVIVPTGSISGWSNDGDEHRTTIYFGGELQYSYILSYTDLAGNQADLYGPDEFIIDSTQPEIIIKGVEDRSANSGDINPTIYMRDDHFDEEGVDISLVNSKGKGINLERQLSRSENAYVYSFENINSQPDEIYTLTATATDLAGNRTQTSIRFSLNREGSVYDLSQISKLSDKGYIRSNDMGDIHIKEMNISSIKEFIMIVTKNDKAITGKEVNSRPLLKSSKSIYYSVSVTGNDDIGYEYDYTIYKEAFMDEGIYNVMFYSKDAAGNEVNNTLDEKAAELTFIIDNTAPSVSINGIDEEWFILEETKDVNVYINDNFKLTNGYFELVDEDQKVISTFDYMELAGQEGDVVTITIPATEKYCSLGYYASDAAGNEIMSLSESKTAKAASISQALISSDKMPSIILGVMVGVIILLVGISIKLYLNNKKGCQ